MSAATLRRAHAVHPCRAEQNEYSLWTRLPELGMLQTCAALGVAFVPFSPLGCGVFGRDMIDPATLDPGDFRLSNPRFQAPNWLDNAARLRTFRAFAAARGLPPAALAMAWVLHQGDHLIPIPGTRTADHLGDWIAAADIALSEEDRQALVQLLPVGWAAGDRYGLDQAMPVERYC